VADNSQTYFGCLLDYLPRFIETLQSEKRGGKNPVSRVVISPKTKGLPIFRRRPFEESHFDIRVAEIDVRVSVSRRDCLFDALPS
jgi:hypothetical protein